MTDTANAMVSAVGVLAALYHQRRTGEGQDLWTSLLNGAAVFSSDVFLVDGEPGPVRPGSIGTRPASRRATASTRHRRAGSSWPPSVPGSGPGCAGRRPARLERHDTVAARIAARPISSPRSRSPSEAHRPGWLAVLTKAGVAAELSIDTNDGEPPPHDADNERLGLVAEYPHPTGRMRQFGTLVDFSDDADRTYGRRPCWGSTPARSWSASATAPRRSTTCWPGASSTSPTRTIAGSNDRRRGGAQCAGAAGDVAERDVPVDRPFPGHAEHPLADRIAGHLGGAARDARCLAHQGSGCPLPQSPSSSDQATGRGPMSS